jgi:hypothetical protein
MKVKVLRNTVASGKDIFEGTIVDIPERDVRILVNLGKVRTLTEADAQAVRKAMKEETERALKGLVEEKPVTGPRPQEKTETPQVQRPDDASSDDPKTQRPYDPIDPKENGGA